MFSIIALQEVWSFGRDLSLPGYHPPIFNTRDMNSAKLSPNCGGGVAVFIDEKLNYSKLHYKNEFVHIIYESIWIKVNLGKAGLVVVGNIYRPGENNLATTYYALCFALLYFSQDISVNTDFNEGRRTIKNCSLDESSTIVHIN